MIDFPVPPNPSIERIHEQQQDLPERALTPRRMHPQVLVVGCVDARKNLRDVGFGDNDTLALRNIGATIVQNDGSPEAQAQEAALKEAIGKGVKDIVILGHTGCGGMEETCLCHMKEELPAVHKHLEQYQGIRNELVEKYGDPDELLKKDGHIHAMEREMGERAVRLSLDNLRSYDVVREAEEAGLHIHAWVMNTANGKIKEWNSDTQSYGPVALSEAGDSQVMDRIRKRQQFIARLNEIPDDAEPPAHNPSLLVISEMASPIDPDKMNIIPGDALIYRTHNPCGEPIASHDAALEFAIKAKQVTDVIVMLPFDDKNKRVQENGLRAAATHMATSHNGDGVRKHYWLLNKDTQRIFEMTPETGKFRSMAGVSMPTHY